MGERGELTYDREKLLFRRQFILGPGFGDEFPSWRRLAVSERYCLTVHPDLAVTHAARGDRSLTLVGYLLNPYKPGDDDDVILEGLLGVYDSSGDVSELIAATAPLSGRWVLIVRDGEALTIFHDPVGLRQVFFTQQNGAYWCASQPGILSEVLRIESDPVRFQSLVGLSQRTDGDYWWPADLTPFDEIACLLPNHCLDLETGVQRRYWPTRDLGHSTAMDDAIEEAATILKGTLQAAARRNRLAMTITAGLDSRTLLAAAREIGDDVQFFTLMLPGQTKRTADVRVPLRLAKDLDLNHEVIQCPVESDTEFIELIERNVTAARKKYHVMNQATYAAYPDDWMCVYGLVSEVARRFYHRRFVPEEVVTPEFLAAQAEMDGPIAIEALDRWLQEVRPAHRDVDILDIFYWEHRLGGWTGLCQAERDIAQEVLMPYNCRRLLETLLSVDEKYRTARSYLLFRGLIARMWPEALKQPINPRSTRFILERVVARARRYVGAVSRRLPVPR